MSYIQYLVLEKQIVQAKASVAAARKSLPADRANLALAQCYAMLGETTEAERRIQAALGSPACDLATIRGAVDLSINQGRFDQVEPILDRLNAPAMGSTPEVLAWANRTRFLVRLSTGRLAEMDQALALIELNLKANPSSVEDQKLKAVLLALRTSGRGDAIKLLERFDQANQLGTNEQFILAQTYLSERLVSKYQNQMQKLLRSGVKNPRHLIHFVEFLLDTRELGQAEHWLAELRRLLPRSLYLLELEARLLDLRKRKPELLALLLDRGRQIPDEIGSVAGLLERFGCAVEAEAAYRAFIVRDPNEPERVLRLASFLARQEGPRKRSRSSTGPGSHAVPKRSQRPPWDSTSHPPPIKTLRIGWSRGSPRLSGRGPPRPRRSAPSSRPSIAGKDDTTRPRPCFAKSSSAIPTTSRRSTTWPGSWHSANRANRGKPSNWSTVPLKKKARSRFSSIRGPSP